MNFSQDNASTEAQTGDVKQGYLNTLSVIKCLIWLDLKRFYYVRFTTVVQPLIILNIFRAVTFYYMSVLGGQALEQNLDTVFW